MMEAALRFRPLTSTLARCHPEIIRPRWSRSGSASASRPVVDGLLKGLRAAVEASCAAGVQDSYIDGSFCTETPDPGDIDGYWVDPDEDVYDRIDPYWIDFDLVFVPLVRKWKWRMWGDYGVEFFIHPAMQATPELGFPEFFRQDRDGQPRGLIQVVKAEKS